MEQEQMMTTLSLAGLTVAILATDGVEQVALTTPRAALEAAGARTLLVAPGPERITSWNGDRWGAEFAVDVALADARAEDFDALLVPGALAGTGALHTDPAALAFVRAFDAQDKPIAAICHGPWLLAAADIARGRRIAAWPTLARELRDAGAVWVDSHVVVDGRILTCRSPRDLASFMRPTIAQFAAAQLSGGTLQAH
jgi:protease I